MIIRKATFTVEITVSTDKDADAFKDDVDVVRVAAFHIAHDNLEQYVVEGGDDWPQVWVGPVEARRVEDA